MSSGSCEALEGEGARLEPVDGILSVSVAAMSRIVTDVYTVGYSTPMTPRRRLLEREEEILDATRALFDDQGVDNVRVARIARAAGINKALIYRHFSSKEELFVLTVTRYLGEIERELTSVDVGALGPEDALAGDAGPRAALLRHRVSGPRPAAHAPSVRPAGRAGLGRSPAALGPGHGRLPGAHRGGAGGGRRRGAFVIDDPDRGAAHLYSQALGTLHLARLGMGVRRAPTGPRDLPRRPGQRPPRGGDDALAHARGAVHRTACSRCRGTTA